MSGKGRMTVTGDLKEVMKEWISPRTRTSAPGRQRYGIKPTVFEKTDVHVHVPEGATPKDGPRPGRHGHGHRSVLTGIPVRKDVAMTGEVTLRGRVWPSAA